MDEDDLWEQALDDDDPDSLMLVERSTILELILSKRWLMWNAPLIGAANAAGFIALGWMTPIGVIILCALLAAAIYLKENL